MYHPCVLIHLPIDWLVFIARIERCSLRIGAMVALHHLRLLEDIPSRSYIFA